MSVVLFALPSCKEKSTAENVSEFQKNYLEALMIHDDIGDIDASIRYLDSSFIALDPKDPVERFRYYEFHYNSYRRNYNDNEKALIYSDSMIIALKNGASVESAEYQSHAYSSRGDALLSLGKYEEAFTNYYKARIFASASQNTCAMGDHDYRMGMVLYKQEKYLNASHYFKQALTNVQSCEENFRWLYRQQEVMDNIGLCYYNAGKNDSAIHYYKEALTYIDKNYLKVPAIKRSLMDQANAVVYGNLATAYYKAGKSEEAKELLAKSISINSNPGYDIRDAQLSRLKLANYYLDESNTKEAKRILDNIKSIADTLKPREFVALGYQKTMSRYYAELGDHEAALSYLAAYTDLKETTDNNKKKLLETDLNARFENLKKEQEIATLAESNKRKQEYLILLIAGALMTLVIGILVIRNWKKSRHNVSVLSKLNKHIKDQNLKNEETLNALAKSNKEKDRILRAVSHDIRNPILAVSSLAELMEIDIESFPEEQKEYITLIKEACTHALNISNDLIEISSSKQVTALEKEYTDLNAILTSCINLLRFRAAQKNQQISLSDATAAIDIYANKEKIKRVINNIITNAIKFTPDGGLITIAASADNKDAIITIKDEGIGIPKEHQDKIFDMFTEAKRPGTDGEKPFGLGLSISKQIVEAHNGKIWFDSKPDSGTTFYISIPLN